MMGCGGNDNRQQQEPLTASEQRMLAKGQDPRPQRPSEGPAPAPTQQEPRKRQPMGERLTRWIHVVLHFEHFATYKLWFPRTRALVSWTVRMALVKVPSFLYVVLGPKVSPDMLAERNAQCDTCVRCVKVIEQRRSGPVLMPFCGSCSCGQWVFRICGRIIATSCTIWKNQFANHDCPDGVHDGSQNWRDAIPEKHDEHDEGDEMGDYSGDTDDPGDTAYVNLGQAPADMAQQLATAEAATFGSGGGAGDGS